MRNGVIWAGIILAGLATASASSSAGTLPETPMAAAAQKAETITVPAGTRVLVRMVDSIDSSKQKAGFRFTATLETNLQAVDVVVARRGTTVYGHLTSASSAGKMSGSSELTLELTDIVINGTAYPLSNQHVRGQGQRRRLEDREKGSWRCGTGCPHWRHSGRRKRSWDWCARRCCYRNGRRRF